MEDVLGFSREVMADDLAPSYAKVHPDDLPGLVESIAEIHRSHTSWHFEYRYRHPTKGEHGLKGGPPRESSPMAASSVTDS